MTINRIRALVENDFNAVNALLIERIQSQVGLIDDLSGHIVKSGGKRLRPLLVLIASRACGYEGQAQIGLAAMIECFHTATLLHDDVVDESLLRRGKETANSIWGSKASILVGDYLLTQSLQLLTSANNMPVLRLIVDTAHQISCGEIKQLHNRFNAALDYEQYFEVIRAKTALLFAAASAIGAHLSEAGPDIAEGLYNYGLHLGNTFQLIDDALDYCSDAKTIGKNIGDDLADGKATLPLIHAMQHGNARQQAQIRESLQKGSLEFLPEILQALEETQAIRHTKQIARQEADLALTALQILPASIYRDALADLANFAIEREF